MLVAVEANRDSHYHSQPSDPPRRTFCTFRCPPCVRTCRRSVLCVASAMMSAGLSGASHLSRRRKIASRLLLPFLHCSEHIGGTQSVHRSPDSRSFAVYDASPRGVSWARHAHSAVQHHHWDPGPLQPQLAYMLWMMLMSSLLLLWWLRYHTPLMCCFVCAVQDIPLVGGERESGVTPGPERGDTGATHTHFHIHTYTHARLSSPHSITLTMAKREPPRSQEFIESSGAEDEEEQQKPAKKTRAKDADKAKKSAKVRGW